MDYTLANYQGINDKFGLMLRLLPEIRQVSQRGEQYLYSRHMEGEVPYNSLLMEMLHSKRKWTWNSRLGSHVLQLEVKPLGHNNRRLFQ